MGTEPRNRTRFNNGGLRVDWETGERLWRCSSILACYVVLQFVVACSLAMLLYPGGYEFGRLFLSDLGVTKTSDGSPNGMSFWLFNGSLAALGLGTIPFYLFFWVGVPERPITMWAAAVLGLVSCCAQLGIALTPYDIRRHLHELALATWIASLVGLLVLHTIAILRSHETSTWLVLPGSVVLGCIGNYAFQGISMVAGQVLLQSNSLVDVMNPMMAQKLLVAALMAWYAVHSLVAIFLVREARPDRTRAERLNSSAKDYANTISRRV